MTGYESAGQSSSATRETASLFESASSIHPIQFTTVAAGVCVEPTTSTGVRLGACKVTDLLRPRGPFDWRPGTAS